MNFRRSCLSVSFVFGCLAASAVFLNCKDDDKGNPAPVDQDASPFEDVVLPDTEAPKTKFEAVAIPIELRNQPNSRVTENKVFPSFVAQVHTRPGHRKPDAVQSPGKIEIDGMGCVGYANPTPQDFEDSDMGPMTLEGLTAPGLPNPIKCTRAPDPHTTVNGYSCNMPPFIVNGYPQGGLALKYAPVDKFVKNTDRLNLTAPGGKDVGPFVKGDPAPPMMLNISVTTDLWNIRPEDVDGTKDIKFEYNCGGDECLQASAITLTMVTTDGNAPPPPDGQAEDPYQFPLPATGGKTGLILCQNLASQAARSFTVEKQMLKVLGTTWKKLYVQIAPVATRADATAANDKIVFGTGIGYFGISKR